MSLNIIVHKQEQGNSCGIGRFSLDCRIGIGFGFSFGFTTSFGWLVYLLWFWFYDSQVKTALKWSDYDKYFFSCKSGTNKYISK